jgi:hypothetical protein
MIYIEFMAECNYAQIQARYGGQFIAYRNGQILASAPTYEALQNQLEALKIQDDEDLIIEYVERSDCAYVY